jgi:transcriptional regulator with XRE-family HTH domain
MGAEWFAGRLKELRQQAGLTQQQLAEKAGMTKDGVSHLEQGRRSPSWETVLALASAFGVSVEAFAVPPAAGADAHRPRGRPRKDAEDRPASKGKKGKKGRG